MKMSQDITAQALNLENYTSESIEVKTSTFTGSSENKALEAR